MNLLSYFYQASFYVKNKTIIGLKSGTHWTCGLLGRLKIRL